MYQHANGARLDAASFAPDQAGQAQINQIRRGIGEIGAPVSVCSTGAKREDPAYPSAAAARHQCFFRGCSRMPLGEYNDISASARQRPRADIGVDRTSTRGGFRSAEHTSELQSLMRISYAA